MNNKIVESAYAKINLMLDIVGVRQDGYHLIDGIMQTVSLADCVEVSFLEAPTTNIQLHAMGNPAIPQDSSNLAYQAADLYLQTVGVHGKVEIWLQKKIPAAAGLAGGSSDAAATLRALNRLLGSKLNLQELCTVGVRLGADVPFCIRGGAMRVEGIGEQLTPIVGLADCWLVVACTNEQSSTPTAYRKLDALYNHFIDYPNPAKKVENLIQVLRKEDLLGACRQLENIFEKSILQENIRAAQAKQILQQQGALKAMMSGSGPSVFGVFESELQAYSACKALEEQGVFGFLCQPVSTENVVC